MNEIRIPNIENYIQEISNGELILTPKQNYITEKDLNELHILHSTIEKCIIKVHDTNISTNTNYRAILIDIWKTMNMKTILKTTTFNIKLTDEKGIKGYNWCPDLKISFQSKDARGTLKEILNMVKTNKLTIALSIKLESGNIIHYKN